MSVFVYAHKYAGAQGSQKNIRSLGAGVIGIWELPSMNAAVQMLMHKHLEYGLTRLPLQPPDVPSPRSPCGSYVLKIDGITQDSLYRDAELCSHTHTVL